jgi:hypothetical protein
MEKEKSGMMERSVKVDVGGRSTTEVVYVIYL